MMNKLKVIELFAGIGAFTSALDRGGYEHEIVDAIEIDKFAIKSFNAIHNTNFEPQDITKYNKSFKDIDIIMHGSPCQDFSIAGLQKGGDKNSNTRSSLMYETIRIVENIKPKYIIWENVKNLLSKKHKHNFDNYIQTLDKLGYNSYYNVLDSKDFGVPQHRERIYTISIRKDIDNKHFQFPEKQRLKLNLKDILEDNVDEKYYISNAKIEKIRNSKFMQERKIIQEKDYCDTLCARDWKDPKCVQVGNLYGGKWDKINESCRRVYSENGISPTVHTCQGGNTEPKIETIGNYMPSGHDASRIVDNNGIAPTVKENHGTITATNYGVKIRKLTPKECWRLQGFTDKEFDMAKGVPTSDTQLYKQAGNSITVNVLLAILNNLFKGE